MPHAAGSSIVVAICVAFSFIVFLVGGVSVWTNLPDRKTIPLKD